MRAAHQMNGMISDGIDTVADTLRTDFRREFREITRDQLTGQWIGDGTYIGVHAAALLFNPFKAPPGSGAVVKTLRTVVGAVEKEAVKIEQKVAAGVEQAGRKAVKAEQKVVTHAVGKAAVTAEESAATTFTSIKRQTTEFSRGSSLVEALNRGRAEASLSQTTAVTTTTTTTSTTSRVTLVPSAVGHPNSTPQIREVPNTPVVKTAPQPRQTTSSTASETKAGKQRPDMGEYRHTGGHHVHSKKAFEGDVNYDLKKAFSISEEFMDSLGVKHSKITGFQQQLYREFAKSGRPNTLEEHTRIAIESLVKAGAPREKAIIIVEKSVQDLIKQGITEPTTIPWGGGK